MMMHRQPQLLLAAFACSVLCMTGCSRGIALVDEIRTAPSNDAAARGRATTSRPNIDRLILEGRLDKALAHCDQLLATDPRNYAVLLARGRVREENGELKQALEDFSRAIEIEPTNPEAYYYRSRLSEQLPAQEASLPTRHAASPTASDHISAEPTASELSTETDKNYQQRYAAPQARPQRPNPVAAQTPYQRWLANQSRRQAAVVEQAAPSGPSFWLDVDEELPLSNPSQRPVVRFGLDMASPVRDRLEAEPVTTGVRGRSMIEAARTEPRLRAFCGQGHPTANTERRESGLGLGHAVASTSRRRRGQAITIFVLRRPSGQQWQRCI